MAIDRSGILVPTDDAGDGVSGDPVNAAWVTLLLDRIDAAPATATAYTPTWGNTGTANSIGNGALTGTYWRLGKIVHFTISLSWGSTTSSGNGTWTFTTPFTMNTLYAIPHCQALAVDSGVAQYVAVGCTSISGTVFLPVLTLPSTGFTATTPMTWGNADGLTIVGWFYAA